ncbi:MAG: type II 3-dehydroquinate dehydratase [Candidatus Aureabacteria bacterium]|nr:type II 3-dehydroquinate dehydratase [Candidatus Auribacterota bacterium]
MTKISIINGPNLNLLGQREEEIYGNKTLNDIEADIKSFAKNKGIDIDFYQSNAESDIIDKIHSIKSDPEVFGLIINAGAYTHTSIAIMDALKALKKPVIEVHLSNIFRREEFRRTSYISLASDGVISGLGPDSYLLALEYLVKKIK